MNTKTRSFAVKYSFDFGFCGGVFIVLAWLATSAAPAQAASYALGTTALLVGPSAGSNSVILAVMPQTASWTATANTNWLRLDAADQNGIGSTNVVFSFDANPGATRSSTLTIAGQTLTITQAGSTYIAVTPPTVLAPIIPVPADTEGPLGMAADGAGNAYTLFSDDGLAGECWFLKWTLTNNAINEVYISGFNISVNEDVFIPGNILAADIAGNIYITDIGNNAIKEWLAASGDVTNLVSSGLNQPSGVAVDGAGNVYIADTANHAIEEWTATNGNLTTLVSLGTNYPIGVAVDTAGNVYIADAFTNAIFEWTAADDNLTNLVSLGANYPQGLAVDGSGNVYAADTYNNTVTEWTAASRTVTTLVSVSAPCGVTVDRTGNVYVASGGDVSMEELPYAFVDPTAKVESAAAGNDSLPAVLPATENLLPPLAPTSDSSWLTISSITNDVVSFSFTANPGATRTAYITLLGQSIPVTQAGLSPTITYSLGATESLVGPSAGSNSVVLVVTPATGAWLATANAVWLHLSPANQAGVGSTNVIFSYDANSGPTRSGSLTIAGQTLTVIQAGSTYVAAGAVTALVSSGLHFPNGVAVDNVGNVYIADSSNNAIKEWTPTNNAVKTLLSVGLNTPESVAVDGAGNVYIADTFDNAIKEWLAASGEVTNLVSSGLNEPYGVAVDAAGNVYIADTFNNAIKEWSPVNNTVNTLVSFNYPQGVAVDQAGNVYIISGVIGDNAVSEWTPTSDSLTQLFLSSAPYGLAVDGAGNVYVANDDYDNDTYSIQKWTAASDTVSTLAASGLDYPSGVAVDTAGNVYIADTFNNAIEELPYVFVDPTAKWEGPAAGNDSLPVVLPATQNLLAPFAPASDSSWLAVSGITNDVVSFSITANTGSVRTAHITLLGQSIPITQVTQGMVGTPPAIANLQMLGNGVVRFEFTNNPDAVFTVLSANNLSLPLTEWTAVGSPTYIGGGLFQFTSPPATNDIQRFYIVHSP